MIIRDVEDRDAEVVQQYAEDFLKYYPLDIEYEVFPLLQVLENISERGIFLVAEKDGVVVGGIGGLVVPHTYAPMHLVATEMFLWVSDEHRGSTVGPRLLKAFEKRGQEAGCRYIAMTSTVKTPNFKSFLEKKQYIEAETSYIKEM